MKESKNAPKDKRYLLTGRCSGGHPYSFEVTAKSPDEAYSKLCMWLGKPSTLFGVKVIA